MRINSSGTYEPCRWMTKSQTDSRVDFDQNIKKILPHTYFQKHMAPLRTQFLQGQPLPMCQSCVSQEQYGKPSGRLRQLLKIGVQDSYFEKSLFSSPLRADFDYSNQNQGHTQRTVSDWQIDLGNYCNGSCVYCHPNDSSSLATEFKKLGLIDQLPAPAWCDDPELLDRFIADLTASSNLQYLHFLGGETVITPGFKKILSALVEADLANQVTIGFTTNLTVWSEPVTELLCHFANVNLGMSIETLTPINDYVRYPSKQQSTRDFLQRWTNLGQQQNWLMQLRMTPTCLTVHELDTVYDYAWENNISVESCNFLSRPEFLRIGVLPRAQRDLVKRRLQNWIDTHPVHAQDQIINTRNPNFARPQIVQDAKSYLNYIESAQDESYRLGNLVTYLKLLESNRGNCVLDYLPQYEDLFRSAGY